MNLRHMPEMPDGIVYPESDGKRVSGNTKQFLWITTVRQPGDPVSGEGGRVCGGDLNLLDKTP